MGNAHFLIYFEICIILLVFILTFLLTSDKYHALFLFVYSVPFYYYYKKYNIQTVMLQNLNKVTFNIKLVFQLSYIYYKNYKINLHT